MASPPHAPHAPAAFPMDAASELLAAGWAPIPVQPGSKQPLFSGITGREGRDLTLDELTRAFPAGTLVGVRMPAGVIGLDVDAYQGKRGAATLAEAERRWGPLPEAPASSARDDGVSGIRFFRVAPDLELAGVVAFAELGLADVELIQRHHRLAVVAPSVHPVLGVPYRWNTGSGQPPLVARLPALPDTWVAALGRTAGVAGRDALPGEVLAFMARLPDGPPCPAVRRALDGFAAVPGSRHDSLIRTQQQLARLGDQGHHGAGEALDELRHVFVAALAGERNGEHEFDAALPGAVGPVLTAPTPSADRRCCPSYLDEQAWASFGVEVSTLPTRHSTTAAPDTNGAPAPRTWNLFDVIGSDPFDPDGGESDQALAEAVALRMYPVLRFSVDTGSWLIRHAERWEDRKDDTATRTWPLVQLTRLMPAGDPTKPTKGARPTREQRQAARLAKFRSSSGGSAVGSRLRALVADHHPAALETAGLDADPEILWAGGLPWDLRRSAAGPVTAVWVEPATPHLHTAMCAPDNSVPTPAWDQFTATVLPDAQLRAWALRVLAVGFTGHADAVLPILFGPERSGKTTLVKTLVWLLGTYAAATDAKLLGAEPPPSLVAGLKGRRLAFVDEGPRRGHGATERLKQLTGGGQLAGAKKYRDEITFDPTHTLVMTSNNEPALTDPALRARLRLIPCEQPESVVRPAAQAMLAARAIEAPGVLAALMRSAAEYLADLDSVSKAAAGEVTINGETEDELAAAQDPIRIWVEQHMERLHEASVEKDGRPATDLLDLYCAWLLTQPRLHAAPGRPDYPTPNMFGRRLTVLGVHRTKAGGAWRWGLRPLPISQVTTPTPYQFTRRSAS